MKAETGTGLLAELVSAGRVQPADAELLRCELGAAEKRGAAQAGLTLSWTAAGIAAVLWALHVPAMLAYNQVAPMREIFEGMGLTELPRSTQLLVSVPLWAYVTFFLAMAVVPVVTQLLVRNKAVTLTLNVAAVAAALVYAAFVKLALFAPMVTIMEKLGATGGAQ